MRLETRVVAARLREPFETAAGAVRERELVLVALSDDDAGIAGYGEAAPLAPYTDGSIEECLAALESCRAVLAAGDGVPRADVLAACAELTVLRPVIAALDVALWDLEGRRAGVPVWELLGGGEGALRPEPGGVRVNATIAAGDRAGAAAAAARAREDGFACVKVKVGLGDDAGRIAAVRAACGPSMSIRLDANGAWSVEEALASLRALEPAGIELCEEPVHGLEELALVAAGSEVAVALDESTALDGALDRRVGAAACLKIASCGGITGVVDAATRARRVGYEVYLASMLDGPLGIAAALHAAVAVGVDRPCGLATLGLFEGRGDPIPVRDGQIALPPGPGLGDGLLDFYDTADP